MDFIAIDFETADTRPDSPCELGLAIVRGGVVREARSWLIKPACHPWFSPFNVAVHGIRPEHVANAPDFAGVWAEVAPMLVNQVLVAHNAAFDMGVLRASLTSARIPLPELRYFCSVSMARRVWPGKRSYGLGVLCAEHGIAFRHHRAGDDSAATAELVLRATERHGAADIGRFLNGIRLGTGSLGPQGQRTPGGKFIPVVAGY